MNSYNNFPDQFFFFLCSAVDNSQMHDANAVQYQRFYILGKLTFTKHYFTLEMQLLLRIGESERGEPRLGRSRASVVNELRDESRFVGTPADAKIEKNYYCCEMSAVTRIDIAMFYSNLPSFVDNSNIVVFGIES